MHNEWNTLPDSARLWIYGANRILNDSEQNLIKNKLGVFCAEWSAHGEKLRCGFDIIGDCLIVLGVDENQALASGCSIDSSVAVIRELDTDLKLDLFNRLRAFVKSDNSWKIYSIPEFKEQLVSGKINGQTPVFDTTIQTIGDLKPDNTRVLKTTWLGRYVPAKVPQ